MPLCTLNDVKRKLGLAEANTSENESVRSVLLAADRYVLRRMRRALSAGTVTSEVHKEVQVGRSIFLELRPVSSITSVVGRVPNSDQTNETISYDLVDAAAGELRILGADFAAWPPKDDTDFSRRFQNWTWPYVYVTYTYSAYTPTADVSDACAHLASYWWSRQRAGTLSAQSLGAGFSETYLDKNLPPGFEAMIASDAASGGLASWV